MTASPHLGANAYSERAAFLLTTYQERVVTLLKDFMQDGYLPGTWPPRSKAEEYLQLVPQWDHLMAIAMDVNLPAGRRERAQKSLRRTIELEAELSGT